MEYDIILCVCIGLGRAPLFESPFACLSNHYVGKLMGVLQQLGSFYLLLSPWMGV